MYQKWYKRLAVLCLAGVILLSFSGPVRATTTGQQLQDAQNDKQRAENGLDRTNENVQKLKNDRASLQTNLDKLNAELQKANGKLLELQNIIEKKEEDIRQAKEDIEQTRALQASRYEEMKQRIKFMYERGNESYLELFFSAKSFADMLNKADYIEMINAYDRNMLDLYEQTEQEIIKKEQELTEDKKTLELLEGQAHQTVEDVYAQVEEASKNISQYMDRIREEEEKALAYERELAEAESDIATLTEQYKQELAMSVQSASMTVTDLSDVYFASGDEDLLAAIIECEAGGESYTGKVAVGAVVLNRVRSPLFPSTVLEVIMQNKQFSPVASGRFSLVLARGANESCYQAAQDAMAGASPVGNCLFFRTPIPGLTGQQIGGHIFY